MDSFQTTVLTIAVIVLIIILIIVAIALRSSKDDEVWPPVVGDCPDYWIDTSGNGANCVNVKYLGTCGPTPPENKYNVVNNFEGAQKMDFSTQSTCQKYTFANNCRLTWDGITGTTNNPCSTTTTTS
jgi:hypothetical protein